MLRGHLDIVTSSGYVDGWAYDTDTPARPLALGVWADEQEIARGLANRYRADLVDAGCGTGWCAFRFRVTGPVGRLRRAASSLRVTATGEEVYRVAGLNVAEENDLPLTRADDIVRADPTLVHSIDQLRGCGAMFATLIGEVGLPAFIRAAYIYVLGRPADPSGLETYGRLLAADELTPFGLLQALCDSDEFRAMPRLLIAPTEPGFIFNIL